MSLEILQKIDSSTSFMYDVEQNTIKNQKNNAMWIFELEELCHCLNINNFAFNIDQSSNITDIRKTSWPKI